MLAGEAPDADDPTEPEKAALALADLFATDHLRVDDALFARLREHFDEHELMELCLQVATFAGYGRMGAGLAMTDDLPEEYADPHAVLAPWVQTPVSRA